MGMYPYIFVLILATCTLLGRCDTIQSNTNITCMWPSPFTEGCLHLELNHSISNWQDVPPIEAWIDIYYGDRPFSFSAILPKNRNKITKMNISHTHILDLDVHELWELTTLRLENNIYSQNDSKLDFPPNLKELYIINGPVSILPTESDLPLTILDLRKNKLTAIPVYKNLKTLILASNQISGVKTVTCGPMLNLELLDLSGNKLTHLSEDSFNCILPKQTDNPSVSIYLNLNTNSIRSIHPQAFMGLNLGMIDLSHNNLKTIESTLLDWPSPKAIDLQNNPWQCDCESQWMLDELVPLFYSKAPQSLFYFRCQYPAHFKDRPLVYWLNRSSEVFCKSASAVYFSPFTSEKVYEIWTISLIAMVVLGIIIVILIIVIIVVYLKTRRTNNSSRRRRKDLESNDMKAGLLRPNSIEHNSSNRNSQYARINNS